ncbi:exopolysaccharide biosynthesis polyprenyl glycosylphosphotransferase [Desulfosporosinus orientis DSM 765]|uniref:Exopolysaccharide biosynthesis polyprenyl glycosylphosphotransferase n=1 Tax=Desulfosporosinus orientis (strain ATCC 19365 / DSM 765 / NCIMB 8382 / VKM B-1628 / Singapore I) TaxID=768706 RepID=G7W771_DESOD|nr:sugar transferase [Desulfosporosinus orientis]AET70579.1 exopolysaccharide biosynthesis polyprenyl glycosylphosphotransferase [Desulfosporosinus orientis DSM 765]
MLREYSSVLDDISQIVDLAVLSLGFFFTVEIYRYKHAMAGRVWEQYFLIFLVYIICWIISSNVNHVYRSRRFISAVLEARQLIIAHLATFAITITAVTLYQPTLIHNRFVFYFEFIALCLTLGVHLIVRLVLQAWRSIGRNIRYVLILGSGQAAHSYLEKIKKNPQLGYEIVGYLAPERNGLEIPYLGDYSNLHAVMSMKIVDLTVVTAPLSDERVKDCLELLDLMGKTVTILLDDVVAKVTRSRPVDFDGLPMVAYDSRPRLPGHELAKRVMDIVVTGAGLIVISPILLAIAIVIKVSSDGPVIFAQERVGLNGRIFNMYKFRSMVVNAEELKAKLAHLNEMSGPVFKISNDPRVTTIGRILRKTSLDELPQLWNVLMGDMSLVGPRPPLPSEVNLYDPKHRKRLSVKPGITCIWQISGRNDVDFEKWMEMDAEYVERWSLWMDVAILAKTVPVVLGRKGAS